MSIAIATMGKFIPAVGSGGTTIIERIVTVDGGSSYGLQQPMVKKPHVVVSRLFIDDEKDKKEQIEIEVLSIEEY
jgi:hypothetical protein